MKSDLSRDKKYCDYGIVCLGYLLTKICFEFTSELPVVFFSIKSISTLQEYFRIVVVQVSTRDTEYPFPPGKKSNLNTSPGLPSKYVRRTSVEQRSQLYE